MRRTQWVIQATTTLIITAHVSTLTGKKKKAEKTSDTRTVRKTKFQPILALDISLANTTGQWQITLANEKLCEFGPR